MDGRGNDSGGEVGEEPAQARLQNEERVVWVVRLAAFDSPLDAGNDEARSAANEVKGDDFHTRGSQCDRTARRFGGVENKLFTGNLRDGFHQQAGEAGVFLKVRAAHQRLASQKEGETSLFIF